MQKTPDRQLVIDNQDAGEVVCTSFSRKVTVPVHGTQDVKIKTLLSIEKQSGVKLK